ncbi:MAG: DUF1592 domain-containing protein [Myxococcaceae bacterium]
MCHRNQSAVVLALVFTGCFGTSKMDSRPVEGETTDPEPVAITCREGEVFAGAAPVRRLTRAEYNNTVRDLLGDDTEPANVFGTDGKVGLFTSNAGIPVTSFVARNYQTAAQGTAKRAAGKLSQLAPCDMAAGEKACAAAFIERFGKRAYRRPLSSEDQARFMAAYEAARARGLDYPAAVTLLIEAFLQSPNFINHVEKGDPYLPGPGGQTVALTSWEIASRLSYFLWNSMPDDALFAAAESGALSTVEGIAREARRLLADPRAKRGVGDFYAQWLELARLDDLKKNAGRFPEFDNALKRSMRGETEAFLHAVLWEGDARLDTLLTADFTYGDASIAKLYGVAGITDISPVKLQLDRSTRAGLLTQPALMAIHSYSDMTSPIHRGKFIRERLFCDELPSPPAGVNSTLPEVGPGATVRQRLGAHKEVPSCAGCHVLMDPIGFGFEHYDAIGRFRTRENDQHEVDANGEIFGGTDSNGAFYGARELADRLAQSDQVRSCVLESMLAYSTGHPATTEDECSLPTLLSRFKGSGGDLQEALVMTTQTDAFRFRRSPEACQ